MRFWLFAMSLLWGCNSYVPEKFVEEEKNDTTVTQTSANGTVSIINTGNQICNSSISQDTIHFPSSMLWLGFTDLSVKNAPDGYDLIHIAQHDRLTITNFDNEVQWFLMKDSVPGIDCEFQDPEWSSHPGYLSTLGQHKNNDNFCNEDGDYSGYAIRTIDKAVLQINERKLNNLATPHIWIDPSFKTDDGGIPDSVWYDDNGFVDANSIKEFFGTTNVRVAWSEKKDGLSISWANYSSGTLEIHKLPKPEGRDGWKAESPLFSPDGNFIVYNLFQTQTTYEAWAQELSTDAKPILIAENGMDPRWWKNPWDQSLYVSYVKRNGLIYTVLEDLTDIELSETGDAGSTYMKSFYAPIGSPQVFHKIGEEEKLINLPFKGGISPDGKYMATGTNFAYMIKLR